MAPKNNSKTISVMYFLRYGVQNYLSKCCNVIVLGQMVIILNNPNKLKSLRQGGLTYRV